MGCSCLVSVVAVPPGWVIIQTESETSLFYSHSLKYFSSLKHQNCFNVLLPSRWFVWFVLQGYIYDIVLMTAIFPGMFSPRGFFFLPPYQPKEVSESPILSLRDPSLVFCTLSRSDPQHRSRHCSCHLLHHFLNDQSSSACSLAPSGNLKKSCNPLQSHRGPP